jgi:large subunit ribosomal protein L5
MKISNLPENSKDKTTSWVSSSSRKTYFSQHRLATHYKQIICQDLLLKYSFNNIMEIPQLSKIVCSTTSKTIVHDKKYIVPGFVALEMISGQKLKYTSAKKSIATFKLRKKELLGCKVTLRNHAMYNFLQKFITIIIPRLRDTYKIGVQHLDNNANINIGIDNLLIFPELENHFEYFEYLSGINISIVTKNMKKKTQAKTFLTAFQIPSV